MYILWYIVWIEKAEQTKQRKKAVGNCILVAKFRGSYFSRLWVSGISENELPMWHILELSRFNYRAQKPAGFWEKLTKNLFYSVRIFLEKSWPDKQKHLNFSSLYYIYISSDYCRLVYQSLIISNYRLHLHLSLKQFCRLI